MSETSISKASTYITDLIEALQAGPGSRELSDRVLEQVCDITISNGIYTLYDGSVMKISSSPTESVDDALKLVPDDDWITWTLICGKNTENTLVYSFELEDWHLQEDGMVDTVSYIEGVPTPALAICIAILKATQPENPTSTETQ